VSNRSQTTRVPAENHSQGPRSRTSHRRSQKVCLGPMYSSPHRHRRQSLCWPMAGHRKGMPSGASRRIDHAHYNRWGSLSFDMHPPRSRRSTRTSRWLCCTLRERCTRRERVHCSCLWQRPPMQDRTGKHVRNSPRPSPSRGLCPSPTPRNIGTLTSLHCRFHARCRSSTRRSSAHRKPEGCI